MNLKKASDKLRQSAQKTSGKSAAISSQDQEALDRASFVHLHNHSQYSILQSTSSVADLVNFL